jgi:hypothetical protein
MEDFQYNIGYPRECLQRFATSLMGMGECDAGTKNCCLNMVCAKKEAAAQSRSYLLKLWRM